MRAAIKLAEPAGNEFLSDLEARSGKPNHFLRMMGNRPDALRAFVPFYAAVTGPGTVDRRTKELVYLACSFANKCAYCTAAHVSTGKKAGVTADEMLELEAGQDSRLSEPERAAVRYARELTRTANAVETRNALMEEFTDEQVVEITMVVAMANFTNRFNNGLLMQPES